MSDLPEGWECTTLENLTDARRPICYGILMPKEHIPDGVPYVKVKDFSRGPLNVAGLRRTSPEIAAKYQRSSLVGGDVLISIRGTYGRVVIAPPALDGANITQDTARIAVIGSDRRYVALYLQSPVAAGYFRLVARGVAVKGVNIGDLKVTPVPFPPGAEQERIVAALEQHLSRLDAAELLLAEAEERIKALARVSIRRLFDSRSWPWTTLGKIAEIKGGVTKDSKRQADPAFVEVPYLRVANVQRGRLDLAKVTTICVHPDTAKALRLEPGDVLLNEGGDRDKLGRGWVWEGEIDGCIHQNHVFRARLHDDFDPYFVSTHANTWGQAWFEEHGRQTTNLASINLVTLRQLPVPAPPRVVQESIVAELRRTDEARQRLIESIEQARKRAGALRRSILAAAFAGQLVRQDPDDEPASTLLERIRAERRSAASTRPPRKANTS